MYMYIHKMYDNNANKEDHNGSIYVLYVHVYNMYKYIIHVYIYNNIIGNHESVHAIHTCTCTCIHM